MTVATPFMPAFGEAIRPCLEIAYRLAEQLTESPRQAEDCLTEAALTGSRVRPFIEPGIDVRPWFMGLVMRSCGSRYRRWEPPSQAWMGDDHSLPLYEATGAAQQDAEAAAHLFSRLSRSDVSAALRSLPWEMRKLAALYYVAEFRYDELAAALEVTTNELRPMLRRAKRAMQQALCARARAAGILPQ
jgi:RNA polymerase sigma factor (sigma-70 family)